VVDHHLVALALARERAADAAATMRWKCSETPGGANWVISVSTVGLPGGSRKPSLARQPIMLFS
jgi:hypothetical protein